MVRVEQASLTTEEVELVLVVCSKAEIVQKTVEEILVVSTTTAEWSIELIAIQTVVGVAVDMSGQDISNLGVYVRPMVFPSLHG